jgi:hypothetical protein
MKTATDYSIATTRLERAISARRRAEATYAKAASRLEAARAAERSEIAASEALLAEDARALAATEQAG